jgi:hypothetical protein
VPLTLQLTIVSASTCAPLAGRAVYLWHCDALGRYSLYSSGATNQNYLRGVQEADAGGKVTFTSIYPGCYAALAAYPLRGLSEPRSSTSVANKSATRNRPHERRVARVAERYTAARRISRKCPWRATAFFSDGSALELATITGSVASGFTATLTVAV